MTPGTEISWRVYLARGRIWPAESTAPANSGLALLVRLEAAIRAFAGIVGAPWRRFGMADVDGRKRQANQRADSESSHICLHRWCY